MHLKTTVGVPGIGDVDISTIDLSIHGWGGTGIETCIFFPGGDSEVVAHYGSRTEARVGHKAFSFPQVIGYVFASVRGREDWLPRTTRLARQLSHLDPVLPQQDQQPTLRSSNADSD